MSENKAIEIFEKMYEGLQKMSDKANAYGAAAHNDPETYWLCCKLCNIGMDAEIGAFRAKNKLMRGEY